MLNSERPTPWIDPSSGEPLIISQGVVSNPRTNTRYQSIDGIPLLFVSETGHGSVTDKVKAFYEETPFPRYDDLDSPAALVEKARRTGFAYLLNEQIPFHAQVAEIGCGTGQLTNFLAISQRSVIGVDASINSLRIAQKFKVDHGLDRATFAQMNLFHPCLRSAYFDYVISNGVLHHTATPRKGLIQLASLVRPGGYLVLGLYNRFTRALHGVRATLRQLLGIPYDWFDPHLRNTATREKREAWIRDQYHHPHESWHTLDEVLKWLPAASLEFINAIPDPNLKFLPTNELDLFNQTKIGNKVTRVFSQLLSLRNGYCEGGFFTVIARRRID